jgi:hypothetical protein
MGFTRKTLILWGIFEVYFLPLKFMYPLKKFFSYVILAAVAVISVQCSDDDSAPEDSKSTDKSIASFKFAGLTPVVTATIKNDATNTITATVPAGTSVTALVPTLEISAGASVSPTSGTAQNFTTPVTYTVTAEDGSKQAYTVTVTVEAAELTCLPTTLPGGEATMHITYNANHKVATVTYEEFDEESDTDYRSEFQYTDGKISRVNNFYDTDLATYTTFTYSTETIIERYFGGEGETLEQEHYYIYYLDGSRVTGWAYHSLRAGDTRLDSAVFTYTNDNVTRVNLYGSGDELLEYTTLEYDDKINPYALTGLTGDDDEYFNVLTLSKNNITREESHDTDDPWETLVSYTYNDDGLPLTRNIDDEPAQAFEYTCQ